MLQNTSKPERLRDAVNGMSEESRWGRVDLARQRVLPQYRADFELARAHWGKDIQIADVEVVAMKLNDGDAKDLLREQGMSEEELEEVPDGISSVHYAWYGKDMVLRSTVLEQKWQHKMGNFYLLEESIVDGEASLLREPEPETKDGEWNEPPEATDKAMGNRGGHAVVDKPTQVAPAKP